MKRDKIIWNKRDKLIFFIDKNKIEHKQWFLDNKVREVCTINLRNDYDII